MSDSMQLLETVKQAVSARIVGVAPGMLDSEMRWVVDEFMRATRVWERDINITLVNGTTDYALDIEDYESAWLLLSATYNERVMRQGRAPSGFSTTGTPSAVGMVNDRTLRVYPIPVDATGFPLKVTLCLTLLPSTHAPFPDVIRPYHAAFVDGLLGRMFSMPDKPWTNLKLAALHLDQFNMQKMDTRREMDRGRSFGAQFVRPSPHLL